MIRPHAILVFLLASTVLSASPGALAQQVDPNEVTGSDWSGALSRESGTCDTLVPEPGSAPVFIGATHTFFAGPGTATLTYADTDSFQSTIETAPSHSGTFSGNVLTVSGPISYAIGCSGTATLTMTVTAFQLIGFTAASAEATYDIELTSCDPTKTTIQPCNVRLKGTLLRDDRAGGEDLDLKGRIGGFNLKCILKDGSTKVSGVNVELLAKLKGESEFTELQEATTNKRGVATFKIRKLKKGTKVRCQYGTVSSSEIRVPKLPKR